MTTEKMYISDSDLNTTWITWKRGNVDNITEILFYNGDLTRRFYNAETIFQLDELLSNVDIINRVKLTEYIMWKAL